MAGSIEIRAMTPDDIPAGLRLCRASAWNQLAEDWRWFLKPPQSGGWIAERDGDGVGTVAYLRYGSAFTWISMMLVAPRERRSGIGTRLMATAVEALGAGCLRLDATPAGEPLYRRFGFVEECSFLRMRCASGPSLRSTARSMSGSDLNALLPRDRAVFGADRSELLQSFFGRAPQSAFTLEDAYCFGRQGYLAAQIGPVISTYESAARELVSAALAARSFVIDVPGKAASWIGWLESVGFVRERPFLRMCRGGGAPARDSALEFAIAGPEFG